MLSTEQEFNLQRFRREIEAMPRGELERLFLEVLRQRMLQENLFKQLIKP